MACIGVQKHVQSKSEDSYNWKIFWFIKIVSIHVSSNYENTIFYKMILSKMYRFFINILAYLIFIINICDYQYI